MKYFKITNKNILHFIFAFVFFFNFFFTQIEVIHAAPIMCDSKSFLPSLVICGRSGSGPCTEMCEFRHVGATLNNLMYLIVYLMIMLAPLYVIYIGFKMIQSQGVPEELKEVRKVAARVILSIVLFFCAWLIMYTISTIMGVRESVPSFLLNNGRETKPGSL
jgi:hypothetical protein